MKGFRNFLLRGNVVDLAIAVVVGVAFAAVVTSFVKNLLTPLIAIPGKAQFAGLSFTIRHSTFHYGAFLNDLLAFVVIAAVVYFAVVLPLNRFLERRSRTQAATTKACTECLSEIPIGARRCAHCASVQQVVLPAQANEPVPTAEVP